MPPRAISPKSCSRAERSAAEGISGDPGWITGAGAVSGSASRRSTRGSPPSDSASVASASVAAGPSVTVAPSGTRSPSSASPPSRPARSRQTGQSPLMVPPGSTFPHPRHRPSALMFDPPEA